MRWKFPSFTDKCSWHKLCGPLEFLQAFYEWRDGGQWIVQEDQPFCTRSPFYLKEERWQKKFRQRAMWWYNGSEIICSKNWRTDSAINENSKSSEGHEGKFIFEGSTLTIPDNVCLYKKLPWQADPTTVLQICRHCLRFNRSQLWVLHERNLQRAFPSEYKDE